MDNNRTAQLFPLMGVFSLRWKGSQLIMLQFLNLITCKSTHFTSIQQNLLFNQYFSGSSCFSSTWFVENLSQAISPLHFSLDVLQEVDELLSSSYHVQITYYLGICFSENTITKIWGLTFLDVPSQMFTNLFSFPNIVSLFFIFCGQFWVFDKNRFIRVMISLFLFISLNAKEVSCVQKLLRYDYPFC